MGIVLPAKKGRSTKKSFEGKKKKLGTFSLVFGAQPLSFLRKRKNSADSKKDHHG